MATPGKTESNWQSVVSDWAADKEAFAMPWGKLMMWIFLLGDTFIFSIFLVGYMNVRMSTTVAWPNTSEVFALTVAGQHIPLLLIAIMTFVLITSSGTMAMAVNYAYRGARKAKRKTEFQSMTVIDNSDVFGIEGDVRLSEAGPRDFFALLKPRVMSLVVFTAFAGLILAPGQINPILGAIAILCIAVGAGGRKRS